MREATEGHVSYTHQRTILHADMDAYYASVEQHDNPNLRGKAVVVGGNGRRAVIAAASYEARKHGVHSAMPMAIAKRHCPQLVIITPRMARYKEISKQLLTIFRSFSPLVEPLALDEAFIDLSGTERLWGASKQVGLALKQRVFEQTGLIVSVGIGPNKYIAKLASATSKPDGLLCIEHHAVTEFVSALGIEKLLGAGKETVRQMHAMGLKTIGDLRSLPEQALKARFGRQGSLFFRLAHGEDDRPVVPDHEAKTVGHEETFAEDIADIEQLRHIIAGQAERVAERLRRHQLLANTVIVKLKTPDFKIRTRRRRLGEPTCDGAQIATAARELLQMSMRSLSRVRLAGVSVAGLRGAQDPRQLSLGEPTIPNGERLVAAIDQVNAKFGKTLLARGAHTLASRADKTPHQRGDDD